MEIYIYITTSGSSLDIKVGHFKEVPVREVISIVAFKPVRGTSKADQCPEPSDSKGLPLEAIYQESGTMMNHGHPLFE